MSSVEGFWHLFCLDAIWCYLDAYLDAYPALMIISSSAIPFSFCLQSFPAPGSFPVSELFTSSGQNIGTSASTSVLPVNIQGWLGLTGLVSLLSKGLSRVFCNIMIWKHQFFDIQPSLQSNSHICMVSLVLHKALVHVMWVNDRWNHQ